MVWDRMTGREEEEVGVGEEGAAVECWEGERGGGCMATFEVEGMVEGRERTG